MGSTEERSGRSGGFFQTVGERVPYARFLGFSFWVAWFGLAYTSSVWVNESEATSSVVSELFLASTLAHAACWIVFAAMSKRSVAAWAFRAPFVVVGGIGASVGCALVLAAGPAYAHSHLLFLAGGAMTGIGTAAIGVRAGVCLCSVNVKKAILTVLSCVILGTLFQFVVRGVPFPVDQILFCLLPACSSACLLAEPGDPSLLENAERQRILPSRSYGRLLASIVVLSAVSYYGTGKYQLETDPSVLAQAGSLTSLLTMACCAAVYLAQVLRGKKLEFVHCFYPLVVLIVASLLGTYFLPNQAGLGVVVSGTVFQMFDVGIWYVFVYIVQQSKTSSVFVVSLGRAAIALGVSLGSLLGSLGATGMEGEAVDAVVFVLLFACSLVVLLVFPEKEAEKLLLPIPDEDTETEQRRGSEEGPESGDDGADGVKLGHWKRACLDFAASRGLTEREKEVLILLARGYGSQTISDRLTISLYTTRAHTRNIYAKLDVHSRQELCDMVNEYVKTADCSKTS